MCEGEAHGRKETQGGDGRTAFDGAGGLISHTRHCPRSLFPQGIHWADLCLIDQSIHPLETPPQTTPTVWMECVRACVRAAAARSRAFFLRFAKLRSAKPRRAEGACGHGHTHFVCVRVDKGSLPVWASNSEGTFYLSTKGTDHPIESPFSHRQAHTLAAATKPSS